MITTVTGKNQITIPALLANRLEIQPGIKIDWTIDEDGEALIGRVLPTRGQLARAAAGMGRMWVTPETDPIGELVAEREREDEEEGLI